MFNITPQALLHACLESQADDIILDIMIACDSLFANISKGLSYQALTSFGGDLLDWEK
jgi:hypothetical protein